MSFEEANFWSAKLYVLMRPPSDVRYFSKRFRGFFRGALCDR